MVKYKGGETDERRSRKSQETGPSGEVYFHCCPAHEPSIIGNYYSKGITIATMLIMMAITVVILEKSKSFFADLSSFS